jgi:hypothetical protein
MLELFIQRRACSACGASDVNRKRGGASLEARVAGGLRRAPGERSGLAYAAGFAGVLYLFRYSLAPLALLQSPPTSGLAAALILLLNLLAPAALALAFAAGMALDREPEKSGVLPALFGFTVGMFGTAAWVLRPGILLP